MSFDPRVAYVEGLLAWVPARCERALDVGCGDGRFSRRLAEHAQRVVGIDRSAQMISQACELSKATPNAAFIHADFLEHQFASEDFDFIVAIASVHHMDFEAAVVEMTRILRPGGTLALHGLARDSGPVDFLRSLVALPVALPFNVLQRVQPRTGRALMPLRDPSMTYGEVEGATQRLIPGSRFQRHLVFRYTVVWRKPAGA